MHEVTNNNSYQFALHESIEEARKISSEVKGAYVKHYDKAGDFVERMPIGPADGEPALTVIHHYEPAIDGIEVDKTRIKASTSKVDKIGRRKNYGARLFTNTYPDGDQITNSANAEVRYKQPDGAEVVKESRSHARARQIAKIVAKQRISEVNQLGLYDDSEDEVA